MNDPIVKLLKKQNMKLIVIYALAVLLAGTSLGSHYDVKGRLMKDLLDTYEKELEPERATVNLAIEFQCAIYDRNTHIVSTYVWEIYTWTDNRLKWDPADYDNTKSLTLSAEKVWLPDFKLYHGHDEREEVKISLEHTGLITWIPKASYETVCLHTLPNKHQCHYKIGSWSIDDATVGLSKYEKGGSLTYYQNSTCPLTATMNGAVITHESYPCCPNVQYASLEISITYIHHHYRGCGTQTQQTTTDHSDEC
ncbi:hypothetical protein HELRODRAFT_191143 [Helobdella robusta]|uniref:Neurotransmitter-gated ion-channel ligand-binding domain-containing protein n=1 Tax=Helobdella robusta TaxID=6412 RepID=T1FSN1_HELRO|nr:hypothetical protein HELRODRAFT_191143 [Helobdella robusta]ESO07335.1 hypothetical protein HELRODRAFT_191143 [Helobdella robusta]